MLHIYKRETFGLKGRMKVSFSINNTRLNMSGNIMLSEEEVTKIKDGKISYDDCIMTEIKKITNDK